MKKKISIITYSRAYNYGSALQTYALNFYLRKLGNDVRTIDYTNKQQKKLYRIFEPLNGFLSTFRNIHSLLNCFKLFKHKRAFENFLLNNVPMTGKINCQEDLCSLDNEFDYFICGSDQIWNVDCDDFDSNYMLSFVSNKKKCIAYAPSLGAGASNVKTKEIIGKYTSDFKALSSREAKSATIIEEATQKHITKVLDPVFLLSAAEWTGIIPNRIVKNDYILGYFIGDVEGMRDFASRFSKHKKMPVVVIYKNLRDLKYRFINHYEVGPTEFVSLILNANSIVTNSFHAVSFSIIFQKNFWAFVDSKSSDSRITGLLEDVKLKSRLINNTLNINMLENINYERLDFSVLNDKINVSKNFLKENLE